MSDYFYLPRGFFTHPAFKDEPLTNRMALVWMADKGRIIRAHVSDLASEWNCAERKAAAIVKRLAKHGMISVHGSGAIRTIFIETDLIRTCGFHQTARAEFRNIKGGAKWRGGALAGPLRRQVMERDGEVCAYCGCTQGPFHIDHIKPVTLGGLDTLSNLTVACKPCNLSKGGKSLKDWRAAQ